MFSGFSNTGQREKILQTKSTSSSAQLAPFGDDFHPARGTSPVRGFFEEKDGHDTTQSTLVSSVKVSHSTETSSSKQRTVFHLEFSSYVGSCVIIIGDVNRHVCQVLVDVNVDILAKYGSNRSDWSIGLIGLTEYQSNQSRLRTLFLHFPLKTGLPFYMVI